MRDFILSCAAASLLVALGGCAEGALTQGAMPVTAEGYGRTAADIQPEKGYTEDARHIADCLANHPSYDYRTDRYRTYRGSARRCSQ